LWDACSILRWGYLAEFAGVNWPDEYEGFIGEARLAVDPGDGAECEIIALGPIAPMDPEKFQTTIVACLGA